MTVRDVEASVVVPCSCQLRKLVLYSGVFLARTKPPGFGGVRS